MHLLRYLTRHTRRSSREIVSLLQRGQILVDGEVVRQPSHPVTRFSKVETDGKTLPHESAVYLMLHKPVGYVSATVDRQHPTVIDLIDHPQKGELHLVGRLDRNTSGLVLLTNDGRWSKQLSDPASNVPKVYLVETNHPIPQTAIEQFACGFYFPTEDIFTQPADLEILEATRARLVLYEGRYHQVKRMFHRVGLRVIALHRERVGSYHLPNDLKAGEWRGVVP